MAEGGELHFKATLERQDYLDGVRKIKDAVVENSRAIEKAFEEQESAITDIVERLDELAEAMDKAEKAGDTGAYDKAAKEAAKLTDELEEAKKEFSELQKEFGKGSGMGNDLDNPKTKLRQLSAEITNLTAEYRNMSEEEQQSATGQALLRKIEMLTDEAANLSDVISDVRRATRGLASDTKGWDALAGGINVATSAIGGFTGAASILGATEEDLQEIQTKLQASLAISNALSVIQNNLQKESNLMLGVAEVKKKALLIAENLETAAKGKNVVATTAATVAQKAFNLVAKANPYVLLATSIFSVVGALYLFSKGAKEAKRREEELAKAAEEAEQKAKAQIDTMTSASAEAANTASVISNLRTAYQHANTEFEKTQILKQASEQFNRLGIECNSVSDAQRLLVQQGAQVIEMMRLQGTVAALTAMRMEEYKKSFKMLLENGYDIEGAAATAGGNSKVQAYDAQILKINQRIQGLKSSLPMRGSGSSGGGRVTKSAAPKPGKTSSWNQSHANMDAKDMLDEWKKEMTDLLSDVQQDIADANVEFLEESTEKTLAKIDEDEKKELDALFKQQEDLIAKRKELDKKLWEKSGEGHDQYNYQEKADEEYIAMLEKEAPGLLDAFAKRAAQISRDANKQREEITRELAKQEREAMLAYLKEYGDMEQQKLAITQEYEEKISEARKAGKSPYEIASLEMQRDKQLEELNTKALGEKIDWGGVFSSLEGHTKEYLEGLRDQLQSLLSGGNLPVDQMATIQEKLREINTAISEQGNIFSFVSERAREHNRLQQEAEDAQKELNAAVAEQAQAETNLSLIRMGGNKADILIAEAKLGEARKKTASATVKAKQAEDAAARTNAQKIADTFNGIAEWTNKYLSDLPGLLGKLGLGDASDKTKMGLDAINDAAGAAADFASGNYIGAAMKAFNALDNLGNIIGVGGLSDKTLEADIERLTQSNENLEKAIDALADQMENASVLDVKEIYEQQKKMLEQTAAQTREMMQRSGAAYNSGFWGTGIGGSGSSNKKINKALSAADWQMVSRAAGKTIRDAAGFWTLSSKEMYQVMRDANAQWTVIMDKANDGTADAAKFMNEYIELWKKQEELENAYKERWTNVSFDSVKDSFLSALSDMDKSASDFSDDFTKYLFDAVMNAKVGDLLNDQLQKWYDNFSRYMESGAGELTDGEIASLRQQWDDIVSQGMAMRDSISRATGYSGSSSEGSATYNAAKSFTQEQGDILNGRLTAIQINTATGNALRQQIINTLNSLNAIVGGNSTAVMEIRNMMIYTNSYLEDVARYAKKTYEDFGEKMDRLVINTQNL